MAQLMMVNPRRRKTRRKTTRKTVARRRKSPVRRRRVAAKRRTVRRYRRNPTARGIINAQLMPAAVNASGALALDIVWGYLPIPETVKTGPFKHVAKGAGAIALGVIAGNVVNSTTAKALSQGALTVVMHDAMREVAQNMLPGVPLGYYSAGLPVGVGEYVNGLGEVGAYIGAEGTSPYLSQDTLSKPFAGPSSAEVAKSDLQKCLENEGSMGCYY